MTAVFGQEEATKADLDNAILEVFPTPSSLPTPSTNDCVCVPYYLCKNQTINTDGEGLLDIRYVLSVKIYTFFFLLE